MVQVLLPARLLQEAAACAVLGAALGAARAFLPVRGRAAFAPDVLLSGAVLLACQSYAAGYSAAGVLRWYMAAAAFAAALCAAGVLGVPLRALGRGIRPAVCSITATAWVASARAMGMARVHGVPSTLAA